VCSSFHVAFKIWDLTATFVVHLTLLKVLAVDLRDFVINRVVDFTSHVAFVAVDVSVAANAERVLGLIAHVLDHGSDLNRFEWLLVELNKTHEWHFDCLAFWDDLNELASGSSESVHLWAGHEGNLNLRGLRGSVGLIHLLVATDILSGTGGLVVGVVAVETTIVTLGASVLPVVLLLLVLRSLATVSVVVESTSIDVLRVALSGSGGGNHGESCNCGFHFCDIISNY